VRKEELKAFLVSLDLGSELIDYSLPDELWFLPSPEDFAIPKADNELKDLMLKFETVRQHKDVIQKDFIPVTAEMLVGSWLRKGVDTTKVKELLRGMINTFLDKFDLTFSQRKVKRSRYSKRRDGIAVYSLVRENKSKGIHDKETYKRLQERDGIPLSETALKEAKKRGFKEIYPDKGYGTIRERRQRDLEASPLSPCERCSRHDTDECLEWKWPSHKKVMFRHPCRKLERWLVSITGPDSDKERSFDTIQGTVELESQGDQIQRYMGNSKDQIQRVLAGELEQAVYFRFRDDPAEIFECRTVVYEHPLIPPRKTLRIEPLFEKYHIPPEEKSSDPLTFSRCKHGLPSSITWEGMLSERWINYFVFQSKLRHFPWSAYPYNDMIEGFYAGTFKPRRDSGKSCNICSPRPLPSQTREKRFEVVVCPILGRVRRCIKHKKRYYKCSICAPPSARIFAAEKERHSDAISDFRKSGAYLNFFDRE
jgi:hypothetical protein